MVLPVPSTPNRSGLTSHSSRVGARRTEGEPSAPAGSYGVDLGVHAGSGDGATELDGLLALLREATDRTECLMAPIHEEDFKRSHHPVMGPIAWDVGHIGQQEDLWLVQTLGGQEEAVAGENDLYNAYRHPRDTRSSLPLLAKDEVKRFRQMVRARAERVLRVGPGEEEDPLWRDLFLVKMVLLHEHQHNETILQHLHAFPENRYTAPGRRPAPTAEAVDPATFAFIPGGPFRMGVPSRTAWTYDNEWDQYEVLLPGFWMQRTPVTNGQFLAFIAAGGYADETHWDPDGHRRVVREGGAFAPMYWRRDPRGWWRYEMDRWVPLPLDHPVSNISWYEADAFARWAGFRLPSEAEWERVATWDEETGTKRTWPWGESPPDRARANLDQQRYGTDPVGSHPEGVSGSGLHQLVGDAWEWTASGFEAYPGFAAFPYPEYSEIFFGRGLKVLRGGSWATRPWLRLGTFRNWDLPERRQVFAGLRLAADASTDDPSMAPTLSLPHQRA